MGETTIQQIADAVVSKVNKQEEWMSADDVSKPTPDGFGISVNRQNVMRSEKLLPYYKRGRFVRYKRSELNEWFEAGKVC